MKTNIRLEPNYREIAKIIGRGNRSTGVRIALVKYWENLTDSERQKLTQNTPGSAP